MLLPQLVALDGLRPYVDYRWWQREAIQPQLFFAAALVHFAVYSEAVRALLNFLRYFDLPPTMREKLGKNASLVNRTSTHTNKIYSNNKQFYWNGSE